jgi:hypothetical protein
MITKPGVAKMLTGKAPFARSSAMNTMAAIVEEQAPPIGEPNPSLPAPLRWCVERGRLRTAKIAMHRRRT